MQNFTDSFISGSQDIKLHFQVMVILKGNDKSIEIQVFMPEDKIIIIFLKQLFFDGFITAFPNPNRGNESPDNWEKYQI